MDESRRRGGGGAATAVSKKPAAAAYGSAPRFAAPFSPSLVDYAEIFGDVAGSCSIPFLDLPPASDGGGAGTLGTRGAGFDYSEVFGGLDFGELAAPYEELFVESRRDECPNANRRTKGEVTSGQQSTEDLECSSKYSEGGHLECREGNSSDNDSTQFNRLHNKTNHGNKKGVTNGESNLPHAVPAFSPVIDTSTHFQNIGGDGPYKMLSDGVNIQKQHKKSLATSYNDDSKRSENYLKIDQKRHTNNYPVPGNGHANTSPHLSSSSNSISSATNNYPVPENGHANASPHLSSSSSCRSSAEVASSDIMYFSVSDISLRTQPMPVPPPSRAPPRLSNEKEYPHTRILSTSKSLLGERNSSNPDANEENAHVHKDIMKDNSPSFFDVEVDISSAAAASAAAMREAMELAEAKLRSAKQLMDKKRDIHQNKKKLVHQETIICKEQKLDQALTGKESSENVPAKVKRKEASAPKLTQHFKEKEKVVVFSEEDGQRKQENDMNSSKQSKSEDKSEKWKTNNEYHEMINSEKSEVTLKVSETEHLMKKTKIMTTSCEVKHNCVHENSNVEGHDSYEEVRKSSESHKFLGQDVRDAPYAGKSVLSFARNENNVNPSEHCKLHFIHDDKQENIKLEAALETCDDHSFSNISEIHGCKEEGTEEKGKPEADKHLGEKLEKEINIAELTFDPSNDVGKLNVTNATTVQLETETETEVPHLSCTLKIEKIEGDCNCTDSEDDWMDEKQQHNAQNLNQFRRKEGVYEQVRSEELTVKPQLPLSAENEFKLKAEQEANNIEENLRGREPTVGESRETTSNKQVKLMKTTEAVCWQDCNENRAKEAQFDAQQTEKKENNTPESCNLEKNEGYEINENVLGHGNDGMIEIQFEPHFMEKIISMDAIPVLRKRPLSMPLDLQPANLSGERSGMPIITTKCHPLASQKYVSDIKKKEQKEMERKETERQQNEKSERRLEEEKRKEIIQEEEKTKLLEERTHVLRKLEEDVETARSLEEAKRKERKLEEEEEGANLLEANERERKLKEEQASVLKESKEREQKFEEVKEHARSLEIRESEKQVKEEHAMISQEEKERESLPKEVKENKQNIEDEKTKLHTEEVKEQERISQEEDRERLSKEAKENKQKLEDETAKLHTQEAKEKERKLVERREVVIPIEEEKEREREREKDRVAVERAIREAHERAFAEAKERAERIAAERVTSEAWQRAFKESQIKDKKASSETLPKSTDRASREARLRAERAAVERATAEARERAVERALAEKAAADAREHAQRYNSTSVDRTRKDTLTEEHLKALEKDGPHDARYQSTCSLSSYQARSTSNNQLGEGESVLRYKARLERHQRIAERAAKALAEKNMRDNLAQQEQAERNRLADYLDSDIKRWSNGKEGNLRALLSTLHYILGTESDWQPIPLTDVITASAIKKAYRKATLYVHPDKVQQRGARATIQQKYICEKVFDLLKEAWNKYNSEER